MTHNELIALYDDMVATSKGLMIAKNNDYANEDALSNFKLSGAMAGITPEQCCLSQIAIKVSRLGVLLQPGALTMNETVQDTARDLFVYSFLLRALMEDIGVKCTDAQPCLT